MYGGIAYELHKTEMEARMSKYCYYVPEPNPTTRLEHENSSNAL